MHHSSSSPIVVVSWLLLLMVCLPLCHHMILVVSAIPRQISHHHLLDASSYHHTRIRSWHPINNHRPWRNIRGGASNILSPTLKIDHDNNNNDKADEMEIQKRNEQQKQRHKYLLQQQLLLSSRSLQLRQALIHRGMEELQHTTTESASTAPIKTPIDWECGLSTKRYPKSCLYSFDAEIGSKVIAPLVQPDNNNNNNNSDDKKKKQQYQWITLSSLNRLRRTDSSKIEPLWHNQYSILASWFTRNNGSIYSLYHHLNPFTSFISYILDEPVVLLSSLFGIITLGMIITMPLWEYFMIHIVPSNSYLWRAWPHWGRFIHAALPLQLLIVQTTYRFIQSLFLSFYHLIRNQLIEYECFLYEQCIPLTLIEQ